MRRSFAAGLGHSESQSRYQTLLDASQIAAGSLLRRTFAKKARTECQPCIARDAPTLRAVAQFGRAPVSKTGGCGFESLLPCAPAGLDRQPGGPTMPKPPKTSP